MVNAREVLPLLRGQLLQNEPLDRYTSWRIGGPADYLYLPADLEDLIYFLRHFPQTIPVTWLGLGSNTLVRDGGVRGTVVITQGALNSLTEINEESIYAGAGIASAQLARYAGRLGMEGLAFLAGIPGTVGGALAMNAGCFNGETWRFIASVDVINRRGEMATRSPQDFVISYREVAWPRDEWFIGGQFICARGEKAKAMDAIRCLLEMRSKTQPTGLFNCGSVFRNPPNQHAGRLIEQCGLKGKGRGGAVVSDKHANFIINQNHATANDVEQLIAEISETVLHQTGVQLMREVCIVGSLSA
ncbi:MAG: UDP-N-acetylenolpyruvoylglucosamine reductase [Gammaproteobacteria bacterium RIFCSPHIGHO2_12_FULL_42_10]|nr:MAG: UDP-N-acetylenolpyruvoylglucosamine reductase [Gammaproteobacteria bacterium RIFCSPHIGHO2_12_FULL_42_10]